MSGDWILLSEAVDLFKARGQDPRLCIATMITKRLWKPVLPFQEWSRSNGRWLGTPEFDINTSRLLVEIHTLRRGPAALLAARQWREILLSKAALDALWPETPPQDNQAVLGRNRVNLAAKKYFLEVVIKGDRINDHTALELLKAQFNGLSDNFFKKDIWPERPDSWKKAGPIPVKKTR